MEADSSSPFFWSYRTLFINMNDIIYIHKLRITWYSLCFKHRNAKLYSYSLITFFHLWFNMIRVSSKISQSHMSYHCCLTNFYSKSERRQSCSFRQMNIANLFYINDHIFATMYISTLPLTFAVFFACFQIY